VIKESLVSLQALSFVPFLRTCKGWSQSFPHFKSSLKHDRCRYNLYDWYVASVCGNDFHHVHCPRACSQANFVLLLWEMPMLENNLLSPWPARREQRFIKLLQGRRKYFLDCQSKRTSVRFGTSMVLRKSWSWS